MTTTAPLDLALSHSASGHLKVIGVKAEVFRLAQLTPFADPSDLSEWASIQARSLTDTLWFERMHAREVQGSFESELERYVSRLKAASELRIWAQQGAKDQLSLAWLTLLLDSHLPAVPDCWVPDSPLCDDPMQPIGELVPGTFDPSRVSWKKLPFKLYVTAGRSCLDPTATSALAFLAQHGDSPLSTAVGNFARAMFLLPDTRLTGAERRLLEAIRTYGPKLEDVMTKLLGDQSLPLDSFFWTSLTRQLATADQPLINATGPYFTTGHPRGFEGSATLSENGQEALDGATTTHPVSFSGIKFSRSTWPTWDPLA